MKREDSFPLGAAATLDELDCDPHPILARLREREPVSWLPALGGWLVTRYDLAHRVMRDPARFTVQDERFSTGQVIGPSMLSLDGAEHARHRAPFAGPFRPRAVREAFSAYVSAEAERLIDELEPAGAAELRRGFAGPLAAATVTRSLGLERDETPRLLRWYDAIVGAVTAITAGEPLPAAGRSAFAELRGRLLEAIDRGQDGSLLSRAACGSHDLTLEQTVSNAAVLLFGGIETTEGMITNALMHLLREPGYVAALPRDPGLLAAAVEESLRLEPAAAVVDRYATESTTLAGAAIGAGELVRVSIAGANRDPEVFAHPDRFDPRRPKTRRHLAFAHGPHVCLGVHLARLEARSAIARLFERLPAIRLDPDRPPEPRGIVFRKPQALHALWS